MHETGVFNVFSSHLTALFRKRFFMYRRSIKTFLTEIFIPIILVILGFAFTKVELFFTAPIRVLTPDVYPSRQRILVNENVTFPSGFDIHPAQIIGNLRDYS